VGTTEQLSDAATRGFGGFGGGGVRSFVAVETECSGCGLPIALDVEESAAHNAPVWRDRAGWCICTPCRSIPHLPSPVDLGVVDR